MKWIDPVFSKSKVRKAGDVLRGKHELTVNTSHAYEVLSNWRSAHAYPMHCLLVYLRRKSAEICSDPVVVQRLKRSPSIVKKLRRISGMSLDRMQDIAGCRSVVSSLAEVEKLSSVIKKSRIRHLLHNEKDYISHPKESGYRCIHLVYKYNATKEQYKNFFIELQIRSRIQHAWATAVEVVDIFTKQALKASYGQPEWKDFFRYVSAEFARLEGAPVDERISKIATRENIEALEVKLAVMDRLRAFAVTTKHIEEQARRSYRYYLMVLEDRKNISVYRYEAKQIAEATEQYLRLETEYAKDDRADVVLVSGDSINNLRQAYPNYFADTEIFAKFYYEIVNRANPSLNPTR